MKRKTKSLPNIRSRQITDLPPPINTTPTVNHTYRFFCTATGTYSIYDSYIACALGTIAQTSTLCVSWASSLRIQSVHVWPASIGTSSTPPLNTELLWGLGTSGQIRDEAINNLVPSGVTTDRVLVFKPPAQSLSGDWIQVTSSSNSLFNLTTCAGTVIDLRVSYTLCNTLVTASETVASASAGNVYYLALDGATSNKLVPIGLPTTH